MKKYFLFVVLIFTVRSILAQVVINELMPNNGGAVIDQFNDKSDWLELYNNSGQFVNLSTYYLSDDNSNKLKWKLPNVNLAPGTFLLIYCSGRDLNGVEYHSNFSLSNATASVGIYAANGATIHEVNYQELPVNVSYGFEQDGSGVQFYFAQSTPGYSNASVSGYPCVLLPPVIQMPSGQYLSPLSVGVTHSEPGVQLHYTLNGNNPTVNDPILSNLIALQAVNSTNTTSLVPTNPALNAPFGSYSVSRSNNRGWVPPYVDGGNQNILKVSAFKSGCLTSDPSAASFLLVDPIYQFPQVPIFTIQTDYSGFFSNEFGIYVYGNHPNGNYSQRGDNWERQAFLTVFDEGRNVILEQSVKAKLHGNGSRHSTQKNIRVTASSQYGKKWMTSALFSDEEERFNSLIIRSPGHRPDCMPRDEYAAALFENVGLEYQRYTAGVLYLNGEYWGIHTLKERLDERHYQEKYQIEEDEVTILNGKGSVYFGNVTDSIHYKSMLSFAQSVDLNIDQNWDSLSKLMDIENYITYISSQIYIANGDWPYNNVRYWKKSGDFDDFASKGHDARWRWMMFDFDGAFGGTCDTIYPFMNNLKRALADTGLYEGYNDLFIKLCSSDKFKNAFINRSCDLLNSNYLASVAKSKLTSQIDVLDGLMAEHINRWRYPSSSNTLADRYNEIPNLVKWQELKTGLNAFASKRPHYVRRHMYEMWNLSDSTTLSVDVNNQSMGAVMVNTLLITPELEGVEASVYPWSGTYFKNVAFPVKAIAKPGFRFKEWLPTGNNQSDTVLNLTGNTLLTAVFEIDPNYTPPSFDLVINEFQANNVSTKADEYGEFDDWVEIYNPNSTAINLNGYYLTDNKNNLTKYAITPNDWHIADSGFVLIWCDDQTGQGQNHANFKLSKEGEFIALVAPDGVTVLDSLSFGPQGTNFSYGREFDGGTPWVVFQQPTPNYSNLLTSVEEFVAHTELKIYPNPSKAGVVFLSRATTGVVYSMSGIVMHRLKGKTEINTLHFSKGVYVLHDTQTAENHKFVVQ